VITSSYCVSILPSVSGGYEWQTCASDLDAFPTRASKKCKYERGEGE